MAGRPWLSLYEAGLPADIEPEHPTVVHAFQAALATDGPALHYFGATLSRSALDRHGDALAAWLQERGVRAGDRVAVMTQNGPAFAIAALAAWKAGAVVVPVNPMLRAKELRFELEDSGARALVALESLWHAVARDAIAGTAVEAVVTTSELDFLDGDVPALLAGAERAPDPATADLAALLERFGGRRPAPHAPRAGDVALLTYTSGTTGPPKGAMNTHGNVSFNAQTYRDWIHLTPADVALGIAPLFHITGIVSQLAASLLVPMPLVLAHRFDAATVLELAERYGATYTVAAITAFIALMEAPGARELPSLRKVYSGGAPIAPATVEAFERRFGAYIHNIYGLTETTSPSHAVPFGRRAPRDPRSGALAIGVPTFNTRSRIVDEHGRELPAGELGEIAVRGPQVVAGYWNRADETRHAFPDGELRTGDVGFVDEHGWFYVVDRKKDQINAAGFKVWPREVEDVLYEHEAVREAAVVGVADEYRGETVKAFVSLRAGTVVDAGALIAFCRERLAAYKVPRQIEFVAELPKTATGKVMRRALR